MLAVWFTAQAYIMQPFIPVKNEYPVKILIFKPIMF